MFCLFYWHEPVHEYLQISGNIKEAIKFNNKAGIYKPNDPSVLYNKKYFKELKTF